MKNILFLAVLALGFVACKSNTSDEPSEEQQMETEAYQKVLDMHDAMMADMGGMRDMVSQLGALKATVGEDQVAVVDETVAILNQAQEAMTTWMQSLGGADPAQLQESKSHDEIMATVDEQMQNAMAMQELFNNAKTKASSVISSLSQPAEQ